MDPPVSAGAPLQPSVEAEHVRLESEELKRKLPSTHSTPVADGTNEPLTTEAKAVANTKAPQPGESTFRTFARKAVNKFLVDLRDYLLEFVCWSTIRKNAVAAATASVVRDIGMYDIVMYKKKGCGFCERAHNDLLKAGYIGHKSVTYHEEIGTAAAMVQALKEFTGQNVTFPTIFVRGHFIGGGDYLHALIEEGKFDGLVSGDKSDNSAALAHLKDMAQRDRTPQFLHVARGGSWYCFQLYTYQNFIRGISLCHVILMSAMVVLHDNGYDNAVYVIASYMLCDVLAYIILGPSPWSPLGVIVTALCWRFRGNSTSILPYKVVYCSKAVTLAGAVLDPSKLNRVLFFAFITNSCLLTVFRL